MSTLPLQGTASEAGSGAQVRAWSSQRLQSLLAASSLESLMRPLHALLSQRVTWVLRRQRGLLLQPLPHSLQVLPCRPLPSATPAPSTCTAHPIPGHVFYCKYHSAVPTQAHHSAGAVACWTCPLLHLTHVNLLHASPLLQHTCSWVSAVSRSVFLLQIW